MPSRKISELEKASSLSNNDIMLIEDNNGINKNIDIKDIVNIIYPIGSIYISTTNINPNVLFGFGNWEKIEDKFLFAESTSYPAGTVGGEIEHTLIQEESPSHTHDRGTMEITGTISWVASGYGANNSTTTGCFTNDGYYDNEKGYQSSNSSNGTLIRGLGMKASNSWTGETSSIGGNQPHNNMPPYLAVYIWKRVS